VIEDVSELWHAVFSHVDTITVLLRAHTMTELELNCWVLGDRSQDVFEVTIPNTMTVSELNKIVRSKKKPIFDSFPADAVVLWKVSAFSISRISREFCAFKPFDPKVSIPDADFDASLSQIQYPEKVDGGSVKLQPTDQLADVFLALPVQRHLHIIVQVQGPSTGEST
jgi:hypothetical protein